MSNETKTIDISKATREELEQSLKMILTLADALAPGTNPRWENNCPEWVDNGNIDDIWEAGQDNGEAFTAMVFKSIIERTLNGEAVGDDEA